MGSAAVRSNILLPFSVREFLIHTRLAVSVMRKALKDVTLSDGTYIPTGTMVYAAATATHRDPDNYDNPDMFDPFRFSDAKESENDRIKQQYVSTSPDYIPFGHGKHAWFVCILKMFFLPLLIATLPNLNIIVREGSSPLMS